MLQIKNNRGGNCQESNNIVKYDANIEEQVITISKPVTDFKIYIIKFYHIIYSLSTWKTIPAVPLHFGRSGRLNSRPEVTRAMVRLLLSG